MPDEVEPVTSGVQLSTSRVLLVALACVVAGTWLYWPARDMGFHFDDFIHLGVVQGDGVLPHDGPLEMFAFAEPPRADGPDGVERMGPIQGDYLPWWRGEDLVIRFFRPLAALSYYADHALFGSNARAFHLSSLAWFAALVAGAVFLFGELARQSGRGALAVLLAGLFFALGSEHVGNVAWLFGRYTLVSVVFCPLALLSYHRWRSAGEAGDLVRTILFLVLGLLGSETPVALSAFFLAYELSLARDTLAARVRGILPVASVLLAFVLIYSAAGYGTTSSQWYIDPIHDPGVFLARGIGENLPQNLMRLLLPVALEPDFAELTIGAGIVRAWEATGWRFLEPSLFSGFLFNIVPLLLVAVFGVQAVRDRTVRFALVGSVLCLLPLSAAPTPQRVLLLPTIGISWVFAAFAVDALRLILVPRRLVKPWNPLRLALALVLLWGLWHEPGVVRHRVAMHSRAAHANLERARALELPEDADRVLLVTLPTPAEVLYTPLIRLQQGMGWPEGIWGLSVCNGDHVLERTGERSFRLRVAPDLAPTGFLWPEAVGPFRDGEPVPAGTELRTGVLLVSVAETDEDGRVFALDVQLDRSLDDPGVWLVTWVDGGWRREPPPAIGESLSIPTRHATP